MGSDLISVEGLRGRLACMHERLCGAYSLAHMARPEQRARVALRLLGPFHRLSPSDFELLLIDWMEAPQLPSVVEACSLLAALLSIDAAEQASTLVDLIKERVGRSRPGRKSRPDTAVVWWAHCVCERCEPLAKHLPAVQRKLRDCLTELDSDLPMLT